jgi:large subunit ribosomal protein L34e
MALNEGRQKSRTLRRVQKTTPGGVSVTQYIQRNPAKAKCANCGKALHGIPRSKSNELTKSQRKPQRPFGGTLCSPCSRTAIISKYRNIFSLSKK